MPWGRVVATWLALMAAETIHGVVRTLVVAPIVGDFRARQLGVLTGSLLILLIAYLSIRWTRLRTGGLLVGAGVTWLVLTLAFELLVRRLVLGASWDRALSDYDVFHGGLLPVGLLVLTLAPLVSARARGVTESTADTETSGGVSTQ